jgi:hypothetical protein
MKEENNLNYKNNQVEEDKLIKIKLPKRKLIIIIIKNLVQIQKKLIKNPRKIIEEAVKN